MPSSIFRQQTTAVTGAGGSRLSLPLDSITRTIEINLLEMLEHQPLPSPVEAMDGQYLL